jgi:hypothetical protein
MSWEPAAFSLLTGRARQPDPAHCPAWAGLPCRPLDCLQADTTSHTFPHTASPGAGHQSLLGSVLLHPVSPGLCLLLTSREQGTDWEDAPGTIYTSPLKANAGIELCQRCVWHGCLAWTQQCVPGISWVYWGPWHLYYKPLSPRFFFFFCP